MRSGGGNEKEKKKNSCANKANKWDIHWHPLHSNTWPESTTATHQRPAHGFAIDPTIKQKTALTSLKLFSNRVQGARRVRAENLLAVVKRTYPDIVHCDSIPVTRAALGLMIEARQRNFQLVRSATGCPAVQSSGLGRSFEVLGKFWAKSWRLLFFSARLGVTACRVGRVLSAVFYLTLLMHFLTWLSILFILFIELNEAFWPESNSFLWKGS